MLTELLLKVANGFPTHPPQLVALSVEPIAGVNHVLHNSTRGTSIVNQ